MNTSESTAEITKALAKAQGEMKNADLDKENPHFRSKYASLASIRDAVVPILSKNGIAMVQGTTLNGGDTLIAFTRLALGDEWMESTYPVAIDKPQQMGSAITYAKRYMLSAMCGIASEEDDDGNAAQEGRTPKKSRQSAPPPLSNGSTDDDLALHDAKKDLAKDVLELVNGDTDAAAQVLRDITANPEKGFAGFDSVKPMKQMWQVESARRNLLRHELMQPDTNAEPEQPSFEDVPF